MKKFLELIGEIFRTPEELRNAERLEFRLSVAEKTLYKAYCKHKGMTLSAFVRRACMNEIDKMLNDHYN